MAISTNYEQMKQGYNSRFGSLEDYEKYYLLKISEQGSFYHNYYTNKDGVEEHIPPVDHHPQLKEYEVWCEGYAATGESGSATLLGKAYARNFTQACHIVMCTNFLLNAQEVNDPNGKKYTDIGRWDYDPSKLSYWGCKLFWSKELAQKSGQF